MKASITAWTWDHRLSEAAGIRLEDLVDESFICFPREMVPAIYDRILAVAAAGGLKPRIVQEAYDETLMLNLVAAGMGIAFLARSCVRDHPGAVRFRTVADFSLPQIFCFLSRPDRPPTLDAMRGLVLQSSLGSEATFAQSAPDSLPVEHARAVASSRFLISEV